VPPKRLPPVRLPIIHIVGKSIAPYESAVILSVTPNHGGVTDARREVLVEECSVQAFDDSFECGRSTRVARRSIQVQERFIGMPVGPWCTAVTGSFEGSSPAQA
jgi:hypothetical protein